MGRDPTRIISDLLKAFINIPVDRIDEEITNTLKFLASHVGGVDRCALYLLSEADNGTTTISNTHEWVKNKKFSRIASQQRVPIDSSTFYTNFFVWGDHLPIHGPSNMSPVEKAGDDASTPPPASQLYIPITSKNKIIGAIGLSSFKKARPWSKEETSFLALIGEIIVTAIDRKNMELAMFTREKYYRSITRSIPVGLLVFKVELDTADLRLVDENPAARTITDAYTSGCIGKTIEQAFPFLVDSGIPEILKNVAMAGTSWSSDGVEFTFQGTTRAYQIAAFQIAPREVAAAFLDVTSQKEMERLLAQENEKLKEIDKMRDEFVATTTHELKTPLVSLIGATEFLLRNFTSLDDEQVLNLIEISYRGSTRLKALINDLLTVYRIESGGISLDTKEIDLVDIIGRVMKDTSFLVKARKQEVVFNPPDKALVHADAFKIEQVLINLVHNASKNTGAGGTITIRVASNPYGAMISVQDTGVGLTPFEMEKLFKKFTKISREDVGENIDIQGTGLGLFISRQIVEAHGGKIWAESAGRNKGATFTFTIPHDPGKR